MKVSAQNPVIAWWSGGVTSAVVCYLCILWFGIENVRIIFIDTKNEDEDTYRFKLDCEKWYGKEIETISNTDWYSIKEVWYTRKSLNVASGAICSSELKRVVRERFQNTYKYSYQAFGFDIDELKRAKSMVLNNPEVRPIFPLISLLMTKKQCIKYVQDANTIFLSIELPRTYRLGFQNNNCFETGCVQGGVGYWQKMQREFPDKFDAMAKVEHELTDLKGEPVTMLKDQSKGGGLVFLKPHAKYPNIKDISMMKGREPEPLFECNGFCGTNDLIERLGVEKEINFASDHA